MCEQGNVRDKEDPGAPLCGHPGCLALDIVELGAYGGDVWTRETCSECGQVHVRGMYVLD